MDLAETTRTRAGGSLAIPVEDALSRRRAERSDSWSGLWRFLRPLTRRSERRSRCSRSWAVLAAPIVRSFPSASRLTLLIAGLPIAVRLTISGEPLLLSIGIDLCFLLALLLRMMNMNFGNFVRLIELQARARAAEISAVAEQAKAREIADRFQMALGHIARAMLFRWRVAADAEPALPRDLWPGGGKCASGHCS